jgi:hypothetical protein
VPCSAGCPSGFTCRDAQALGADGGSAQSICFPNGGGKAGADCTFGPAACESGYCIRKDSGPVCTVECTDDTGCPTDWTCTTVRTVDDKSVQACLPPSLQ